MSKEFNLSQQIRALKATKGFTVKGIKERQKVCRTAKFLKDNEMIAFDVVTVSAGNDTFKVVAV